MGEQHLTEMLEFVCLMTSCKLFTLLGSLGSREVVRDILQKNAALHLCLVAGGFKGTMARRPKTMEPERHISNCIEYMEMGVGIDRFEKTSDTAWVGDDWGSSFCFYEKLHFWRTG